MPKRDLRRFIRFCCVGTAVFAIDFSLIRLFLFIFPPMVSVSLAYFLAVASHFLLSKLWVFKARRAISRTELTGYLVVVAGSWACTASVVWIALHTVTEQVFVAKLLAIPPATLVSFVLMKRLAFRGQAPPEGPAPVNAAPNPDA